MGSQNLQLLANTQEESALTTHRIAETPPDPKFFATRLLRRGGGLNFPANELLGVADVARLLRLCRATIYRLVERGQLTALRIGNSIRFHPEELNDRLRALVRERG